MPPDWAFGADGTTLGKFVARWTMSLYLSTVANVPQRHVMPEAELAGWAWRPTAPCASASGAEAWVLRDVCAGRRGSAAVASRQGRAASRGLELALERSVAGQQMMRLVRGNSSGRWRRGTDVHWMATADGGVTSAGLWWAAQLVRHTLGALGPCAAEAVAALPRRVWRRGGSRTPTPATPAPAPEEARRPWATVAVHIRRGDACERWAAAGDGATSPRPCFRAAEYLRAARALLPALRRRCGGAGSCGGGGGGGDGGGGGGGEGGVRLLVASDSEEAVRELAQLAASEPPDAWSRAHGGGGGGGGGVSGGTPPEVMAVETWRGAGWGGAGEGAALGLKREAALEHFIERRNARGLVNRTRAFVALHADLRLLRDADAFVGTASSWTSRLALLALIGQAGSLPPFELLDKPLGQLWFA